MKRQREETQLVPYQPVTKRIKMDVQRAPYQRGPGFYRGKPLGPLKAPKYTDRMWRVRRPRRKTPKAMAQYWRKRYRRRVLTGRGDYSYSDSRSTGANLGGWLGSKAGEYLGGMAQTAGMALISGLGDYTVNKNVLLSGNMPSIQNMTSGAGITISFQEYLGDVVTPLQVGNSSPFDVTTYVINASNPRTFPWLSQIAQNFEQYEMEGMLFGFRTTSADLVTNGTNNLQLGTVIMATQYDVADPNFASKGEMLNYQFSTSVKPSQPAIHMIECDPRQTSVNLLYTGTAAAGTDPRLYNLGRFSIATQGFQGSGIVIGELHVTYQVRLLKPKLWTTLGENIPWSSGIYTMSSGSTKSWLGVSGTIATQTINNSNQTVSIDNNLDITQVQSKVIFQRQRFPQRIYILIAWSAQSGATGGFFNTSDGNPVFSAGGGATLISQQIYPLSATNDSITGSFMGIVDIAPDQSAPYFLIKSFTPTFQPDYPNGQIIARLTLAPTDPTGNGNLN
ncbi:capsid protein [Crucivirus-264]|nr:capsid protein [Crucivirus-264]